MAVRRRFRPLAAVLLLAVLHNGAATPWTAPPDVVPPDDLGIMHHGHAGMAHPDGGNPPHHSSRDCCGSATCDCGCTATPVALLAPPATVRDWARAEAIGAPTFVAFRPGATGAPFRPPA